LGVKRLNLGMVLGESVGGGPSAYRPAPTFPYTYVVF